MKKITLLFFMSLISFCAYAQFPEDFEGTWTNLTGTSGAAGPAGWAIINVAGPIQIWSQASGGPAQPAYQGTHAAYMNSENVADGTQTEDWLITPSFVVPANGQLRFFSRLFTNADQNTDYKIMISTTIGDVAVQTTMANYTPVIEWTELTLNPTQTQWTEKVVTIPSTYAGDTVYIAFVMMTDNGDKWVIDNVNVVSECLNPTTLTASNITQSSANLNWANPSSATSWEVEVLPENNSQTGTGTTYSGGLPFSATTTTAGVALAPDTCYKYYVRALCSDGGTSGWAGPFSFCTVSPGESCSAPIVVTGLPYTTTDSTNNYGDNTSIEGTPGATGCGTTSAYLGGNDVVYAYTPTTTGVIDITMSPTATWSGIFVYDDCADIGVNCVAGVGNAGTGIRTIANLAVTGGTTYYIVISTWPSPQTTGYTLNILQVNCPPPVGMATTGLGPNSATLNWGNPGGATSWQYVLQAPGAGVPTTAGVTTTTTTLPLTTLLTATAYEYYVRADCGDGTFSPWAGPFSFMTTQVPTTLNYTQGFEGTHGWSLSNGTQTNKWVVGTATANGGTQSLYISNDNGVSNAYTISAGSTVHAYRDIQVAAVDQLLLSFDWKNAGEVNDNVRVWLVPASFVPVAGTGITAATDRIQVGGTYFNNTAWTTVNSTIYASAFSNSIVRLVFEWRNNTFTGTQPPAAIDNINLSTIPCPAPINVVSSNPTQNAGTFTWTPPASGTPTYDYYFSTTNTPPTDTTTPTGNVTTPTYTNSTLDPSTTYYLWVRSNCGDGTSVWVGPGILLTTQVPAPLDFTENWENDGEGWTINNGTQTNKWVVGTAVSNSPTHSIYVSNDNGVTNSYNTDANSVVHAYRDITIPANAAEVNLSFDWKNVGEGGWDYIRVWNVPTSFVPTPGTQITAAADRFQIGGNFASQAAWTAYSNTFNVSNYDGTTRRFVFEWRNDGTIGTQPPAAVDNINITLITCPQPITLSATATDVVATLNWVPQGAETAWEVYAVPTGQPAPTPTTEGIAADEHPFEIDVNPSTTYQFYVRAVCADDDQSLWSGPVSFTTAIGNNECSGAYTLTVNPTDACAVTTPVLFTGATASTNGTLCTGTVNGADVWFEFTAVEQYHSISLSNFTGTAQPIILSVYEGDSCSSLGNPLYCSFNNVINATGLTAGAVYTVRASINVASPSLTTGFTLCVNTPQLNGGPDPTQCQITTINPDFELPDVTGPFPPLVSDYTIPGWRTTATDHMIEIWPDPNYQNVPAYSGTQFIELNANQVSGVYQDYNTPAAGTVFTYSFAHRARTLNTTVTTDVLQLLAGTPNGTYVPVGPPVSATSDAWVVNTGTYTVPAGQPVTRFIFQSISSGNGNPTVGNFLDAISFSANNGVLAYSEVVDCDDNIAEVEAAGGGVWTAHADNPAPTVIADADSNITTISGFTVVGEYMYDWTTEFCSSTITISYEGGNIPQPVVADVIYCVNDLPAPLEAGIVTGNTITWYADATTTIPLPGAPTPSTNIAGTYTYYVSQTQVNCESPRAMITVTVNPLPAAPTAVATVEYCQNATAVPLTATADAGNTLVWYTVQNGGTAFAGAPTPFTVNAGTTVYYVGQVTTAGCESTDRAPIAVTINPIITPVTAFTLPATVCNADVNPVPDTTGLTTGGTFSSPSGLIINPITGQIDLALSPTGNHQVVYTIPADPATCNVGGTTTVNIVIEPSVAPVTTFSYAAVCEGSGDAAPQLLTGFTTGGTFSADPQVVVINPATGAVDTAASAPGQHTITYQLNPDLVNCISGGTATATINITPAVIAVTEFNYNDSYCLGASNPQPSLAANFTSGGTFTATNGLSINAATGQVDLSQSVPGIYTVTYTVQPDGSNCSLGGSFSDTFTINSEVLFTLEGNCDGNNYIITATLDDETVDTGLVTYSWATAAGASVGFDSETFSVTDYAASTPGEDVFPMSFTLTVTNNGCPNTVLYEVPDISCTIQRGISPNNDGLNDNFDLASLGVKKLSIFNRYGKEVYVKADYSAEWFGQTNSGDDLPTGTYFYVIERSAGESKTGWIYVNREEN